VSVGRERTLIFGYARRPAHVWDYQVEAMRRAFAELQIPVKNLHPLPGMTFLSRVLKKTRLLRNFGKIPGRTYIIPVPRLSEGNTFPVCYFRDVVTWSFDCWPDKYQAWEALFGRHRISTAFISAKAAAEELDRRLADTNVMWLPEAADPAEYRPDKPLLARETAVLELGRRHHPYHEVIQPYLKEHGFTHRYVLAIGQNVFRSREALAAGLGDTKLSICFPASMTHPDESGGVETVTHRYFESIASRCLIVGKAPVELTELFGYDPVVEAYLADPVAQLEEVLSDLDRYQDFVDKNYARFLEVGTWTARARQLLDHLDRETPTLSGRRRQ
jgi:hypothetical protein